MKLRLGLFAACFAAYYVALDFGTDLRNNPFSGEMSWWFDVEPAILFSGFASFFLQALSVYLIFFFNYVKRGLWVTLLIIALSFPVLIGFRYIIQEVLLLKFFGVRNYYFDITFAAYMRDNLYFTFQYSLFSFFFFFHRNSMHTERQRAALELQHKKAELELLRSQVNPHVLFNNLNSIYSLVNAKSDKALTAIEHLSELLRFTLYEKREFIPFSEELSLIERYIALHQFRLDYPIQIAFDCTTNASSFPIPPMSVLTLVENALKHGKYRETTDVILFCAKADVGLTITISNARKNEMKGHAEGGVGLGHLQRRLQLLLPDRHTFTISQNAMRFEVTLNLR
ncbi:MAG: histidine kinase [Flavobacteriales bacterium]|nr:histidine kinase [Flavobacteriales bacterium]